MTHTFPSFLRRPQVTTRALDGAASERQPCGQHVLVSVCLKGRPRAGPAHKPTNLASSRRRRGPRRGCCVLRPSAGVRQRVGGHALRTVVEDRSPSYRRGPRTLQVGTGWQRPSAV